MYEIPEGAGLSNGSLPGVVPAGDSVPRRYRVRLLAVLGLTMASGQGCGMGDCPEPDPPVTLNATYELANETDTCPETLDPYALATGGADGGDTASGPSGYYLGGYVPSECTDGTLTEQAGEICTYETTCTPFHCCGYGRPYLDHTGATVASGVTERDDWSARRAVGDAGLDPADRRQLLSFWLTNAAAEHSSVAGFHRFALDLLAHGAPPDLVRLASLAASQEVTHAVDCFSLASAYSGRRVGPEALELGASAPVAGSLAELAAWTVRDGIVGETIAAFLAEKALEQATDPEVRRVLEIVVRDETAHAELAWRTVAWALSAGGDEVRRAVQAVFGTVTYPRSPPEHTSPATVAHGLLPPEARDAAVRTCIDEVLRPVMASLLARDLAA